MPPEQPEIDGNAADTTSTCTSTSAIASATHNNNNDNNVIVGPDLNDTKSPFDKKLYRQILLPNGLRAVLVCDTVAMAQAHNEGGLHHGDDDDDDDDDDEYSNDNEEEDDKDTESSDDSEADNEHHGGHHSEHGGLREAAAAMVVGVGSMYDPPECQGMAHFLEHLLFMGSKKYPLENAYDSFMSKHGGSDNAFTELEHTVYHFEIPQEHLAGALDMFAQFFTSPLLLDSSVERELQSIESEFQLVKNSDNCRVNQLVCHTSGNDPKDHPFAKFSWGNIQSLKDLPESKNVDIMSLLRDFYNKYYYASNMRLVVTGAYSLDVLQEQVIQYFSDIPANSRAGSDLLSDISISPVGGRGEHSWGDVYQSPMKDIGMPLAESCLAKIFYIAPVKDRHSLSVTWQIPSIYDQWRSKPTDYLAHLIGHEAKGSLLASLKEKSWVTSCWAGVGDEGYENASSHALFIVSFTLSEEGVVNWALVVSQLYQYVGMLRYHCQKGLPKWIFDELRSIQEVSHKYGDEQSPEDLVETLAEELAPEYNLPPERLLDGTSLLFDYDPETIKSIIDTYFNPGNARLDMASTIFGRSLDFEDAELNTSAELVVVPASVALFDTVAAGPPQQEPIFGTHYWCQDLSAERLQEWSDLAKPIMPPRDSKLALPHKNPFIPSRFSLKLLPPADCDHPLLNCSLKLQITVGKTKQWFPATVTQFNSIKNQILLSYEDEDEKWHNMDVEPSTLTTEVMTAPEFEGTLDKKKIKYRIVAFAAEGEGAVRKFGDESDWDVEDGKGFPAIPPAISPSRLPKLVCNTSVLKLWHLQDRMFKRPTAELRLQLYCAEANKTPLFAACADLLVHIFSDAVTETAYLASVCEVGSSVSSNDSGFSMRVNGFDDKLLDLFACMFELMMSFRGRSASDGLPDSIKDGRFDACLETYRRSCINSGMKASKLSTNVRIRGLRPTTWSPNQKLKAVENIDIPTFTTTISSILSKLGIEGLYHGNVDATDAERAKREISSMVEGSGGGGLQRKKYPHQHVTQMPFATNIVRVPNKDLTDPNTAVEIYFQVGKDNMFERVMADLLTEMIYEPLYDQIRTKDQFGYHVSCDSRWTNGIIGMHFQIVTSSKSAKEATDRIDKFLRDYRLELKNMSADTFMEHLAGLAKSKLDMFNSLSEETNHLWSEIRDGRYFFQVDRDDVLCLRNITKEQALEAYDKWLYPESKRRMMIVQVISGCEGSASDGRPEVDPEEIGAFIDSCVKNFHKSCKNQTWGKIY